MFLVSPCGYDQVAGSDLVWCVELFERVLTSLSWASLKTPATSTMERPFRAGAVDLKERNTDDRLELT